MDDIKNFEILESSFKEDYQLGKNIGMGSFGYVVSATKKDDGKEYAVKYTKLGSQTCGIRERNNLSMLIESTFTEIYIFRRSFNISQGFDILHIDAIFRH